MLCLVLDSPIQYLLLGVELLIHPLNYSLKDTSANAALYTVLTEIKGGLLKPHLKDKIGGVSFGQLGPWSISKAVIRAVLSKTWAQGVVLALALAPVLVIKCLLFLLCLV